MPKHTLLLLEKDIFYGIVARSLGMNIEIQLSFYIILYHKFKISSLRSLGPNDYASSLRHKTLRFIIILYHKA